MQIDLNTPERLRHNWPYLTSEQIASLETAEVITKQIQHNTNLSGQGDTYTGTVQARAVWVHTATGAFIAEAHGWQTVSVIPAHVYAALGTGISLSLQAQMLLVTVNGGTMPSIMPPASLPPPMPNP